MPGSPALPRPVLEALQVRGTVITANQRAARSLRHAFDRHRHALGWTYWDPPKILAWDAWLAGLWHTLLLEGHATGLLLNESQERTLWRSIIAADAATASLRPVEALAQTAAEAWKRLHAYSARNRLAAFPGNSDTRAFARWADEFDHRSTRSRYLTQAQLPEALRAALAHGQLRSGPGLLLVGFDSKTPAQLALLDALRTAGAVLSELEPPAPASGLTLVDAPEEHSEIAVCARWARAQLAAQPSARIAVIVPSIDTTRARIDRVFREVLAPELNDIASPTGTAPYEFSLGVPLAQVPLAATALDLLRWSIAPLPLDRIAALLLSPCFAAANGSESLARAEFDAFHLRRLPLLHPQLSLEHFYTLVSSSRHGSSLPALLRALRALRPVCSRRDSGSILRSYAEWAASIRQLLEAVGWAVVSQLDSVEFQARTEWEDALDKLATLDFDDPRVSFADALAELELIAAGTLFAPESRRAPIQVMGPLESAGSTFDALWFLRANDLEWPPTPAASPLLPWLLQRELGMPGADPARDAAYAVRLTTRIAGSAPAVVFSYAHENKDGPQRSSSILAGFELQPRHAYELDPAPASAGPIVLEPFADDAPIPPPEAAAGGASILQLQAACGFRAFSEKRLFSSAPEATALGLDARQRGSLVHAVLDRFWSETGTQAALKSMTSAELEAQLHRAIDFAFSSAFAHPRPAVGWPTAYLAAERQRLAKLLTPWLEFEAKERAPFTVESRELKLEGVQIGPLRLHIRVDRIDRLLPDANSGDQAGELILDYKTGKASPADWLGDRPDQPQLPLYALVSERPHLAAIAFAIVRPGNERKLCGIQSRAGAVTTAKSVQVGSLDLQIAAWRETLTRLAEDFYHGRAAVDPRRYPKTCTFCEQRLLCRLDPASLDPDAIAEDSDLEPLEAEAGAEHG